MEKPRAETLKTSAPLGSAVEGYPADSSARDISTARRLPAAGGTLLVRRRRVLAGFAQAVAAEQEDLGVLHQAIGNRGGNGGVEQNIAPGRKWRIGGDNGGSFRAVARGDELIKEIRGLLIERQIP